MPEEDQCKQLTRTAIWLGKEKSKLKLKQRATVDDDNNKIQVITSKKSCVCAPTNHKGSFRCRFHRVVGDGQKAPSSFHAKNNAFKVMSGGGCGGGAADGCSGKVQKVRLSRFANTAYVGASQEENQLGIGFQP